MSTFNSHAATLNDGLGTRLIVAYKQLPDAPLKALVIKVDSITSNTDRDELLILAKSPQAQKEKDFINLLSQKNLLTYYHTNKLLEAVDIDSVLMTPGDGQKIPLRQVLDSINAQNGVGPLPTQEQLRNVSQANPNAVQQRAELLNKEGNAAIAKSILAQAKFMQEEVNKKLEQAYNLDPSLRTIGEQIKSGTHTKPIVVDVTETKVETLSTTKKTKVQGRNASIASNKGKLAKK